MMWKAATSSSFYLNTKYVLHVSYYTANRLLRDILVLIVHTIREPYLNLSIGHPAHTVPIASSHYSINPVHPVTSNRRALQFGCRIAQRCRISQ